MKYHEMTKNYIFREFECGLSIEETAELCFKSVRTVKEWDKGQPIPKVCKRLMRMSMRLELSSKDEWKGFKMSNCKLVLPTGYSVTPQQILIGTALVEISCVSDCETSTKFIKVARAIAKIMEK